MSWNVCTALVMLGKIQADTGITRISHEEVKIWPLQFIPHGPNPEKN